jgi:hypothetical protein
MGRRRSGFLAVLAFSSLLSAARAEDEIDVPSLSFWDKTLDVRGALGYKDNVLLSKSDRQGSAFWLSGLDVTLLRASLDDSPTLTFFVSGEDRRYFSSESVDKEQLLLSQARLSKNINDNLTFGLLGQYVYADQVFDASSTEAVPEILPVKSQNIQAAVSISRDLPWNSKLEASFTGERQIFQDPLDSYWEAGPTLTWSKRYENHSDASLSYAFDYRDYDTRNAITLAFELVPGSALAFDQHKLEFALDHSWDAARHWRNRTKFLFEINQDNSTGFYDYNRYRFAERFGYFATNWQATIEGKLLHYDYARQPVFGTSDIRSTWEYVLAFHAERTVWKKLKIFVEGEVDRADSNYAIEQYSANTVMSGFDWEF